MPGNKLYVTILTREGKSGIDLCTNELAANNIADMYKTQNFDIETIEIPGIDIEKFNQEFKARMPVDTQYEAGFVDSIPIIEIPTEVAKKIISEIKEKYESE